MPNTPKPDLNMSLELIKLRFYEIIIRNVRAGTKLTEFSAADRQALKELRDDIDEVLKSTTPYFSYNPKSKKAQIRRELNFYGYITACILFYSIPKNEHHGIEYAQTLPYKDNGGAPEYFNSLKPGIIQWFIENKVGGDLVFEYIYAQSKKVNVAAVEPNPQPSTPGMAGAV